MQCCWGLQARALCDMPRGGLQLVPFYMRIAATLARLFPDIGQGARCLSLLAVTSSQAVCDACHALCYLGAGIWTRCSLTPQESKIGCCIDHRVKTASRQTASSSCQTAR